jgi:hypothetical protein
LHARGVGNADIETFTLDENLARLVLEQALRCFVLVLVIEKNRWSVN